jgi:hypothetical protein
MYIEVHAPLLGQSILYARPGMYFSSVSGLQSRRTVPLPEKFM